MTHDPLFLRRSFLAQSALGPGWLAFPAPAAKRTMASVGASGLARRGRIQDTLVFRGAEFGRTPYPPGLDGRDHNHTGFSLRMAGGGVKGGIDHGATGCETVENPVHIPEGHAKVLHSLGNGHRRLTCHCRGRNFRLTEAGGEVAKAILA